MNALERLNRLADRWTPRIVVSVIAAAFILSYAALLALAVEAGYHPLLAWLWPLVLDGVVIAASLSLLKRQARGDSTFYAWMLLVSFDLASIYLNATFADNAVFAVVHGLPPLTLVLLLKLYTADIKTDARHTAAARTLADLSGEVDTRRSEAADLAEKITILGAQRAGLEQDIRTLRSDKRAAQKAANSGNGVTDGAISPLTGTSIDVANAARDAGIETRRAAVLDMLAAGHDKAGIAAELGVSPRTIGRDIRELNGAARQVAS